MAGGGRHRYIVLRHSVIDTGQRKGTKYNEKILNRKRSWTKGYKTIKMLRLGRECSCVHAGFFLLFICYGIFNIEKRNASYSLIAHVNTLSRKAIF